MARVELVGATVTHGDDLVIDQVDLTVEDGEFATVVGPSGAGKTSLLRIVAGLDRPTSGSVLFDDVDVTRVEPSVRDVAFAFQTPTVYPRRSTAKNIAFPLEMQKRTAEEIHDRVGAEARTLHIEGLLGRRADKLSVGESQMVQIARALVRNPAVLLLDEPFAALESERSDVLRREIKLLQRGFGVTTIMATNHPREAMVTPDRLVVLEQGRIIQAGSPLDVYERPETAAAALLTGDADVVPVQIVPDRDGVWLEHPAFRVRAWQPALRRHAYRRMQLVVRPEWWEIHDKGLIRGVVHGSLPWGGATSIVCDINGHRVSVKVDSSDVRRHDLDEGAPIALRLRHWMLLDPLDGHQVDLTAD